MAVFRPDIPLHIVEVIHHLAPDLTRSVKQALRALSSDPFAGEPLLRELEGLRKYGVRRFRIVYQIDQGHRIIRIFAVDHRREIYQQIIEQIRCSTPPP